ncbi:hypothetical protein HERIO_237 [Hepatospora eriocheir]|uniref:Uncharacterized protein n=1 Tax=Hepatospora eriocheir TaxID=1081669 RepID=A0A1X0QDN1_9MICR|nr:hypothetical protein HERIO_237 [Hepatospora eriocheir]
MDKATITEKEFYEFLKSRKTAVTKGKTIQKTGREVYIEQKKLNEIDEEKDNNSKIFYLFS